MNKNIGKEIQEQTKIVDKINDRADTIQNKMDYSKKLLNKKL